MTRSIYLPPKALLEIEDPSPLAPTHLVEAVRDHIADHCGDAEWAATVTADEIVEALNRRGYDSTYSDRVREPSEEVAS